MAAVAPSTALPPKKLGRFARMFREPNAIWMREMRQSARLGRTPWVLFALSLTISLLMCSIGGIAATEGRSRTMFDHEWRYLRTGSARVHAACMGSHAAERQCCGDRGSH